MTDVALPGRSSEGRLGGAPSVDASAVRLTREAGAGVDLPRVALLGLNLWAVMLAIPMLYAPGSSGAVRFVWLGAPLVVLAAGTLALRRLHESAMWLLIAVFPAVVAAVIAGRPELSGLDAFPPIGLALGAVSLAAFGGAAAAAVARPRATRQTTRQPLAAPPDPPPGAAKRAIARWLLLGAGALGALALVAIAPVLGGRSGAERAWGDAAAEGALLAVVAGSALGTVVLSVFIGPALRASRPRTTPKPSLRRVLLALVVVASGVVAYVVYRGAR